VLLRVNVGYNLLKTITLLTKLMGGEGPGSGFARMEECVQ